VRMRDPLEKEKRRGLEKAGNREGGEDTIIILWHSKGADSTACPKSVHGTKGGKGLHFSKKR